MESATGTPIVSSPPGLDFIGIAQLLYTSLTGGDWDAFTARLEHWWNIYSVIALLISFLFFVGFIYAKIRYSQLSEIEAHGLHEVERQWATRHEKAGTSNARWSGVQARVSENNPESWRVAIIEADIMLDEVLTNAGYVGQSLGEKLKSANPQSFTTIQDAWEAHKVRNEIAHVGGDFILTKKTAQDTIMRFERVFREFGAI